MVWHSWRKEPLSSAQRIEHQQREISKVLDDEDLKNVETKIENVAMRTTLDSKAGGTECWDGLLCINARPSRAQAHTLAHILEQKNLALEDIEVEASRLQLDYNRLLLKMQETDTLRVRTRDDVNFHKFMLSAVRLLPPEVLIMIFKHAVSVNAPGRVGHSPSGISQVCRAWRNAITGCPSFWADLELSSGLLHGVLGASPTPRVVDVFDPWFRRAGRAGQLTLKMSVTSIAPRLTDLLLFCWKDYQFLSSLLASPSGDPSDSMFPVLEKLTLIEEHSFPDEDEDPPSFTVFGASPRLSTLILSVRPTRVTDGTRLLLPWSQLTRLELVRIVTFQVLAKALFQCPQLHSVYIPHVDVENTDPADPFVPSQPVTFPNLGSLSLGLIGSGFFDNQGAPNVLAALHLPKLESLELYTRAYMGQYVDQSDYIYFPLFDVIAGTSESHIHIRRLLLSHVDTTAVDLPLLLRLCTNLEVLALYIADEDPLEALESLRVQSSNPGHYHALHSKLTSFSIAFHVDHVRVLDVVSEILSGLGECWAQGPLRGPPLEDFKFLLLVCDYNLVYPSTAPIRTMFENIQRRFDALESPFKVSFDPLVIYSPTSILSSFGLNEERPYINDAYDY
ncbi:hypothetical protein DXG01_008855 [Tephrocybe rancida]|nr:hypothetical protein DXG01_008855 [Tephrocybe rancida]